ncbi:MAG: DNA primase DnaG [Candidatus Hodarchaeales archaeon]|jgi:DNA primase
MSKLAQATSKYVIYARFDADGTVEKPDVIGAVFGQTEGLLGQDMDLRELQQTGRVGRIDVEIKNNNGKTSGIITIPSSLDASKTALIAACMETIERVGPCNAKITVEKIDDIRIEKRNYVMERAKELLGTFSDKIPETQEIAEKVKDAVRTGEIINFKGLPAGPDLELSDSIIVVEGRADVLNLLKNGIKNAIAVGGTSIPKEITKLSKQKSVIVFLDGDRGGDLILKELQATCNIDFVVRAPEGKEVEDLTKKEIFKSIREKIPIGKIKPVEEKPKRKYVKKIEPKKLKVFKKTLDDLTGTRAAYFLDENLEILGKVPVKEMFTAMRQLKAQYIVFDGNIDQKLIDYSSQHGIKYIVGMKKSRIKSTRIRALTINDLKG